MSQIISKPAGTNTEENSSQADAAATLARFDSERDDLLTSILRQRRRPLLIVIDSDGELLFSSVPDSAPASEHRLLGEALVEARSLFRWHANVDRLNDNSQRSVIDRQGQRSVLACIANQFYSLRVITLHSSGDDPDGDQFAALVEPIVEPLAKDVDFGLVKQKYRLSTRECDVLEALMNGAKDKDIARSVGLTTGTVRSYLKSIRGKLGVTTRTAIVSLVHEICTANPAVGSYRSSLTQ